MASSYWLLLACIKSRSGKFNQIHCEHPPRSRHRDARPRWDDLWALLFLFLLTFSAKNKQTNKHKHWTIIHTMKERRNTQPLVVRCKLVLVGDVQCGKTAMLQVLAKDCYPEVCPNVARVCGKTTTNTCTGSWSVFCWQSECSVFFKWLNVADIKKKSVRLLQSQFSCAFSQNFVLLLYVLCIYRNTLKCISFFYGMID